MGTTLDERINVIPWGDYFTAYGPAVKVPDQLRRLAGPDLEAALAASHDLWCSLCHQHVQVGSAALSALPFLLEVLDSADREMAVELLDIVLGFALGVNRRRVAEFQRSCGRTRIDPEEGWIIELRAALVNELPRFAALAATPDEEVSNFASQIVAELREEAPPNQTLHIS